MKKTILVIKLGALGDLFMAMEAFHAVRRHHAGDRIVLLTRAPFVKFASGMPWFDEVWTDPAPAFWQAGSVLALRSRLRGGRFDRVYDLQCNDRTAFYFRLLWPRRPEWLGRAKGCSHPRPEFEGDKLHMAEWLLRCVESAGVPRAGAADLSWLAGPVDGLSLPERFVTIIPGCSAHRPYKRWPARSYAELSRRLARRGYATVAVGTSVDREMIDAIRAEAPDVIDLGGKTSIGQLASVERLAAGVVGNDTGPAHIAGAVGAPTLVLLGGTTDPVRHVPRGPDVGWLKRDTVGALSVDEVEAGLRLRAWL